MIYAYAKILYVASENDMTVLPTYSFGHRSTAQEQRLACRADLATARVYAPASILQEMLARLLFRRFVGEVATLEPLDSQVGRGQQWAERFGEHGIGLERI